MKFFFFFHAFTLIMTGIVSTDYLYHLYHREKPNRFLSEIHKFEKNNFCQYYYRYTATETGFGFFAPNVKSLGLFMFDYCNKGIDISFATNEGNTRYVALISNITGHLTNSDTDNKTKSERELLMEQYGELLLQNVTAKYQSKIKSFDPNCKEVTLKYYLIEYPSLATKGKDLTKKHDPVLINIKNWKYEILK